MSSKQTVIVGAGMAGLSCARQLQAQGDDVLVLEKARGSGGRLSSKRVSGADGNHYPFDLGAAQFRATHADFLRVLELLKDDGKAAAIGNDDWIGMSRNSALTRAMINQFEVRFEQRVTAISRSEGGWKLTVEHAQNIADAQVLQAGRVVLACPPAQAAALVSHDPILRKALAQSLVSPQWVVMIAEQGAEIPSASACVRRLRKDAPEWLADVSLESAKRGMSNDVSIWALHLDCGWSEAHVDAQPDDVRHAVEHYWREAFPGSEVWASHVHRWRYSVCTAWSRPNLPASHHAWVADGCYFDAQSGLGVCGDYWLSDRPTNGVESAFLSGLALARRMR